MISFSHVFLGKFANEFCLLCISSLDWIFLPHKSIFLHVHFCNVVVCHGLLFLEWDLEMHMCHHHHITIITC